MRSGSMLLFATVLLALLLPGCGGRPAVTVPLEIVQVLLSPVQLGQFTGGNVTVTAVVPVGAQTVTARTTRQSDAQVLPEASLQAQAGGLGWQGTIVAPANTRSDGTSESYTVSIIAVDPSGRTAQAAAGTFVVPPPGGSTGGPPPPPLSQAAR